MVRQVPRVQLGQPEQRGLQVLREQRESLARLGLPERPELLE